jgi:hypothetical protein
MIRNLESFGVTRLAVGFFDPHHLFVVLRVETARRLTS